MLPQWIIEKKRDGNPLSNRELRFFIDRYTQGIIPDYQMAALAMAVYFKGMTLDESAILTDCMMRSGKIMDLSSVRMPTADKHSTGGIGDKVSLVLAPLVASCGVAVPMISGRGLGITGGTLDKLESIPGYRTDLTPVDFIHCLKECACSITGQTNDLAPADKKLYALRDVTGTVPSIPLICASILSKKFAEGVDTLVLDVKCGSGAFMKSLSDARELAETMAQIARRMEKSVAILITDMDQPLGHAAGNAVEVIESIETLKGNGPRDLVEVTMELASLMLTLSGNAENRHMAMETLHDRIGSGAAFEKFRQMVQLHGGDPDALEDLTRLPTAGIIRQYRATKTGYVTQVNADVVGKACILLGAGRQRVDDPVDHAVGVTDIVKIGDYVEKDAPLLTIYANDQARFSDAASALRDAFVVSIEPPVPRPLILERILPREVLREPD